MLKTLAQLARISTPSLAGRTQLSLAKCSGASLTRANLVWWNQQHAFSTRLFTPIGIKTINISKPEQSANTSTQLQSPLCTPNDIMTTQCAGMKTRVALKKRCEHCYFKLRRGRWFVLCPVKQRHKQMEHIDPEKKANHRYFLFGDRPHMKRRQRNTNKILWWKHDHTQNRTNIFKKN